MQTTQLGELVNRGLAVGLYGGNGDLIKRWLLNIGVLVCMNSESANLVSARDVALGHSWIWNDTWLPIPLSVLCVAWVSARALGFNPIIYTLCCTSTSRWFLQMRLTSRKPYLRPYRIISPRKCGTTEFLHTIDCLRNRNHTIVRETYLILLSRYVLYDNDSRMPTCTCSVSYRSWYFGQKRLRKLIRALICRMPSILSKAGTFIDF